MEKKERLGSTWQYEQGRFLPEQVKEASHSNSEDTKEISL
jgi:hypothetical protein